jgi:hypothetical protein
MPKEFPDNDKQTATHHVRQSPGHQVTPESHAASVGSGFHTSNEFGVNLKVSSCASKLFGWLKISSSGMGE